VQSNAAECLLSGVHRVIKLPGGVSDNVNIMEQAAETKWGKLRKVSYLVQGYPDLEDVISSVNKMIEANVEAPEREAIKQQCRITAVPLPKPEANLIVHLWIPEKAIG
jgi:hypothetical protein